MLKGKKHDHIGLATNDIDATLNFYIDVLGFEFYGEFVAPNGTPCKFVRNQGINYEIFMPVSGVPSEVVGKIDHVSFISEDIESDYDYAVKQGYKITTDGIESIPDAWECGCRLFKIASPTGEEIEFSQKL